MSPLRSQPENKYGWFADKDTGANGPGLILFCFVLRALIVLHVFQRSKSMLESAERAWSLMISFGQEFSWKSVAPKFDKEMQLHSPRPLTGDTNVSDTESIVPKKRSPHDKPSLRKYLFSSVETKWADIPLIICCYIGGVVDGLSYNYWGNFTNMQTGMLF